MLPTLTGSVFVAGFYDPGIISVGNKCLLVPKAITKTINSSNTPFTFDKISLGGFQVWPDSLHSSELIKSMDIAHILLPQVLKFNDYHSTSFEEWKNTCKNKLSSFQRIVF